MNQNELEVAAEERLFDAMLDEVVRGARGVDAASPGGADHGSPWLAAAMVLFGVIVVAGVFVVTQAQRVVAVVPQEPEQEPRAPLAPLPPAVKVNGLAELQALDRGTESLSCVSEGPDFGLLREFTALRFLHVEQAKMLTVGTLFRGAWSLAPIGDCTKLESLSVGPLVRFTAVDLAPIQGLPRLRSLELIGGYMTIDAELVAVLAKLPLRLLVLRDVVIEPEGLRALGELPLLERLELHDCCGLADCDLQVLYHLKRLNSLSLCGVAPNERVWVLEKAIAEGKPFPEFISRRDLPTEAEWKALVARPRWITAGWMRGLAKALPDLRELDLSESLIDDEVLAALPRRLSCLKLWAAPGYGPRGIEALKQLPALEEFKFGGAFDYVAASFPEGAPRYPMPCVSAEDLLPVLRAHSLQNIEFKGIPSAELLACLREQRALKTLKFLVYAYPKQFTYTAEGLIRFGGEAPIDRAFFDAIPSLRAFEVEGMPEVVAALQLALPDRLRYPDSQRGPQQDPLPPAVKVSGLAELQALDVATTNVTLQFQKQEDLAALGRFTKLRALQLEPDPEMPHEGFQRAWSLAPLAECKSLEAISIGYFGTLNPTEFSVLTSLPKLRSLTLVGLDKVVGAELGSLLGKLPLRSLVLHAVTIEPEGLRALGELPLLERLELRDCVGLEKCDLQHLYRLRQLRHLGLRGVIGGRPIKLENPRTGPVGEPISFQLPVVAFLTAPWMRGLAQALPALLEMDLSGSHVGDDVLAELPRSLVSLNLIAATGIAPRGVAAIAALPLLESLGITADGASPSSGSVEPIIQNTIWAPVLNLHRLHRIEIAGVLTTDLIECLGAQVELRELRLHHDAVRFYSFREGDHEVLKTVNLEGLSELPRSVRVELVNPELPAEQALRAALPPGVRVDVVRN